MIELQPQYIRYIWAKSENKTIEVTYVQIKNSNIYTRLRNGKPTGASRSYLSLRKHTFETPQEARIGRYTEEKKIILEKIHSGKRKIRDAEKELAVLNESINIKELQELYPDLMI